MSSAYTVKSKLCSSSVRWLCVLSTCVLLLLVAERISSGGWLIYNQVSWPKHADAIFHPGSQKETNSFAPAHCPTDNLDLFTRRAIARYEKVCGAKTTFRLEAEEKRSTSNLLSALLQDGGVEDMTSDCPREATPADPPHLPPIALLSFPGSGNTWTRHLIEQLTGLRAGSVYDDDTLKERFRSEGKSDGSVVVIKTHDEHWAVRDIARFNRQIVLVRNPFHAIVAEFKRHPKMLSAMHTGVAVVNVSDERWAPFVEDNRQGWQMMLQQTSLPEPVPTLILFYEDLRACLLPQLIKIAKFLRNDQLSTFSFCCALRQREGFFHRPKHNDSYRDLYSNSMRERINGQLLALADSFQFARPGVAKQLRSYVMK